MDRTGPFQNQHSEAMRPAESGAIELLLLRHGRVGGEPSADAPARRKVHANTILWRHANDGLAAEGGSWGQSQTSPPPDALDGIGSDLSEAAAESGRAGTQDLSLPAAWRPDREVEPSLEHRHHLHSPATWICLPGGGDGLVQPICSVLGNLGHDGDKFLHSGAGLGAAARQAGDIQLGSGRAVHESRFHKTAFGRKHPNQHGWPRPGFRQGLCFTLHLHSTAR